MFEPMDHVPAEGGSVARRLRGGRLTVEKVSWRAYRWVMIQFAKYVAVEVLNSKLDIVEIVDVWLNAAPSTSPAPLSAAQTSPQTDPSLRSGQSLGGEGESKL